MGEQVEGQEYLSIDEAAEFIGWNRATVFEWVKELGMEKHKFRRNRKTYLKASDVVRLKEIKEKPWVAGEKPWSAGPADQFQQDGSNRLPDVA